MRNRHLRTATIIGLLCGIAVIASLTRGEIKATAKPKIKAEPLPQILKKVVEENMASLAVEDLDRSSATMHTKSLNYHATKRMVEGLFRTYDLRYKLLSFQYVGADGEYTVARVRQETKKVRGPNFRDNRIDVMHVFRKEKGEWKIWASALLEVKYLDPPAAAPAK